MWLCKAGSHEVGAAITLSECCVLSVQCISKYDKPRQDTVSWEIYTAFWVSFYGKF
jgi:hypothetical protein